MGQNPDIPTPEIDEIGGAVSDRAIITPHSPGWGNSTLVHYNNLELTTHRYGAVSGKTGFHVDISKYPGGEFLFLR